jgi:hypothetical protein
VHISRQYQHRGIYIQRLIYESVDVDKDGTVDVEADFIKLTVKQPDRLPGTE